MNHSTHTYASLTILSPRDLKALHTKIVEEALETYLDKKHLYVSVRGELGKVVMRDYAKDQVQKPGFNFTYYQTPLSDEDTTVEVDLKRSLYEEQGLKEGAYVEVHGRITVFIFKSAKSTVSFRLDAISIKRVESPAEVKERERKADVVRLLKNTPRVSVVFPAAPLRISLIKPLSNEAGIEEDFRKGLGMYESYLLDPVSVSITNGHQIAAAIQQAKGNVLVLIRGGGDASDFDVFSTRPVLEALASKEKVYRITGIGHSRTATVADWMVEHSAVTPTDAGNFIREQLEQVAKRDKEAQCNQQQLTEQLCKVRAQDTEIGGLKQALEHKTELLDRAKATADELGQQHRTLKTNLIIFGAVAVLGLVILLWWLR